MDKPLELYQSSLDKGWQDSKSFDINKLFLVAFFGGIIPLIVLGRRNANWLHVPTKKLYPLIAISIVLVVSKFLLVHAALEGYVPFGIREIRNGFKISLVLLFLYLKHILSKPFQQHMVTNGETEPLLKTAIIWTLIGGVIETILLFILVPSWYDSIQFT